MKKLFLIAVSCCVFFVGCSKEEPAELPALKPVELPKNTEGFYSGRLPCEECKARMVRLELAEDSSAVLVQTIVTDSMKVDTLKGTYSVEGGIVSIALSEGTGMKFLRDSLGNMALLTGAGTVYEDADGVKAELVRILKPLTKKAQPKADSTEGK